jgi:hypothetical protein
MQKDRRGNSQIRAKARKTPRDCMCRDRYCADEMIRQSNKCRAVSAQRMKREYQCQDYWMQVLDRVVVAVVSGG